MLMLLGKNGRVFAYTTILHQNVHNFKLCFGDNNTVNSSQWQWWRYILAQSTDGNRQQPPLTVIYVLQQWIILGVREGLYCHRHCIANRDTFSLSTWEAFFPSKPTISIYLNTTSRPRSPQRPWSNKAAWGDVFDKGLFCRIFVLQTGMLLIWCIQWSAH